MNLFLSAIDTDECSVWGNKCPQMCRNVKGSYKCLCSDGFRDTKGRGTNCKASGMPFNFWLYALKFSQWIFFPSFTNVFCTSVDRKHVTASYNVFHVIC